MNKKITEHQFPIPPESISELDEAMPYGTMWRVAAQFSEYSPPTVYSHLKPTRQRYRIDIVLAFLEAAETHRRVLGIRTKLKVRVFLESLFKNYNVVDKFNNPLTLKPLEQ